MEDKKIITVSPYGIKTAKRHISEFNELSEKELRAKKEYEKTVENLEIKNPFQALTKAIIKGEDKQRKTEDTK